MSPFEQLLNDLGLKLNIHLHPDQHQTCRIQFSRNLFVQIDLDADGDKILIGSDLGRVSPGIYQDRLFRATLQANGALSYPKGSLCYSEKKQSLLLFQYLPLREMTGEKLHKFLLSFLEYARLWIDAIAYGDIPEVAEEMAGQGQ